MSILEDIVEKGGPILTKGGEAASDGWKSFKKSSVGKGIGEKLSEEGEYVSGKFNEAKDAAGNAISKKKDEIVKETIDKTTEELDKKTGGFLGKIFKSNANGDHPDAPDDGKWYDWLTNMVSPKNGDGFLNWKSGIGALVGGGLGLMLSPLLQTIIWPLKQLVGFIPGLGKPLEMLTGLLTSKFGIAAGGAAVGAAATNALFGGEEKPKIAPPSKQKTPKEPAVKTPDEILTQLGNIFENGVTSEELPATKSLLADFKKTDPAGHAALVAANKQSFQKLGLDG